MNISVKNRKYGAVSMIFTAAVLVALVLFNWFFNSLTEKKQLYIDMTKEQMFTLSDSSLEFLDEVGKTDSEITVYFCMPIDKVEQNTYLKYVYETAVTLANRYDYIKIEALDIITDPSAANRFLSTDVSEVYTTDVIISKTAEGEDGQVKTESRKFGYQNFFVYDKDNEDTLFAYDGEYKFISAILGLVYNNPVVTFTAGHGETAASSSLAALFEEAGYTVKTTDLSKENIDPDTKVLVINAPLYDFLGIDDEVNEIEKVDAYLDNHGNMMVTLEPGYSAKLKNLGELLYEWGIEIGDAQLKDSSNSLSVDGLTLVAEYTEEGDGASLQADLRKLESSPKAVMQNASPITVRSDWETSGGFNSRNASYVLKSSTGAEAYSTETGEKTDSGSFGLMTVSQEAYVLGDSAAYSYVLVAGSSHFADDRYLNGNSYGNSDVLFAAMRAFGKTTVPADIDFKVFQDNTLTIETSSAYAWTIVFALVIPVIIGLVCVFVVIRRKAER